MSVVLVRTGPSSACETSPVDCPHCQSELQIHQPDPDLPHRLLAVCEDCHYWYLQTSDGSLILLLAGEDEGTGV